MPRHCAVPGCKSNYASVIKLEGSHSTFQFPRDPDLQNVWLKAIHRKNYAVNKNSVVCSKHFHAGDIITTETYTDSRGNVFTETLTYPKIKEGTVPSIFPNAPKYLSSTKPPARREPEDRRREILQRQINEIDEFLTSDNIGTFVHFIDGMPEKITLNKWHYEHVDNIVHFYILNINVENSYGEDTGVKVFSSVSIDESLFVKVFTEGKELHENNLEWSLPDGKLLSKWSQLQNILARYSFTCNSIPIEPKFYIQKALNNIQMAVEILDQENMETTATLNLLEDQLKLLLSKRKQYTTFTLAFSLIVHSHSSSTFEILRQYLTLPSKRHLQHISSSCHISPADTSSNNHFLSKLSTTVSDRDKIVCLLIDEIYIKSGLAYKSKNIVGCASNNTAVLAKTMQTFMITSPFGHFKEVVQLVPVANMTGAELFRITLDVINCVQQFGFKVLCVITDDNRTNQCMFRKFTNTYFTMNPKYPSEKIFFMFDFVHIFKNIRNNWINKKRPFKTFVYPQPPYPDTKSINSKQTACFMDIVNFYNLEVNQITKRAYKLTHKTLYPNKFERQNVMLVENLFHDSTIAALKSSEGYDGTVAFLEYIKIWWSIVNVKTKFKGKIKRNNWCFPIVSSSDSQVIFLKKFIEWLDTWHTDPEAEGLTSDTYNALKQSTTTLIEIIKYAFSNFNIDYILPGKFQTDPLEKRFGQYRCMSGCNYNVSINQVIESEKKIRIQHIIRDNIENIKNFRMDSLNESTEIETDISEFEFIFQSNYLENYKLDEPTQKYICGYVAHSIKKNNYFKCSLCKQLSSKISEEINTDHEYFQFLQRGGLSDSADEIKYLYYHACAILEFISNSTEIADNFLGKRNHQHILASLAMSSLRSDNFFVNLEGTCECGTPFNKIYYRAALILSNILLNNYTKNKNNSVRQTKDLCKKRKLSTLK